VLNLTRADYDNDGNPDVLLMRGAWEEPARLTLLRNKGKGVFEDVTVAAGLDEPISSESSAWGDYDNDGWLDLFVCGEHFSKRTDGRGRCRLYHNQRDGTFLDLAESAGVINERYAKGSAWGDYDGDGRLDLFVSNMGQECRLYHNEGAGRFTDVGRELNVTGGPYSFSCWFWDYDNDGRLDLFVNDYRAGLADVIAFYLGIQPKDAGHPRLYHNLGSKGFRDVSTDVGLDRPITAMGANFGDIDNDGYLDAYFGTGRMTYSELVPNVMLKNVDGQRFEDVTDSSRTGHLQKGHGVSFADWDCDGDLDLFVELGGAFPGDKAANVLFENPGHGRHWLKVKLVGTRTNRSGVGAQIRVDVQGEDGRSRSIHRVVGNNGSFGGNSLVESIGLGAASFAARVCVFWPTSRLTQTFRNVSADQMIVITETEDSFKVVKQRPLKPPTDRQVSLRTAR
jgi:FG-GAP-like repeat/ASPIC and UnbV